METANRWVRDGILLWVRKGRSASVTVTRLLRSLFPVLSAFSRGVRDRSAGEGIREEPVPPQTEEEGQSRDRADQLLIDLASEAEFPSLSRSLSLSREAPPSALDPQIEGLREEINSLHTTIRSLQRAVAAEHPQYFVGTPLSSGTSSGAVTPPRGRLPPFRVYFTDQGTHGSRVEAVPCIVALLHRACLYNRNIGLWA